MRILSELHIRRAVLSGVASLWLALAGSAPATEPSVTESTGGNTRVLLLKNDHCLSGHVRQLGDQVVIEISPGARVSKAVKEVEFIADNLEGIYQYKLTRYSHLGPGENMRMARWCLSVGLNEHAAKHFLAVNKEAGTNPFVKQLGIELREQLLKDEAFRSYLGLPSLQSLSDDAVKTASAGAVDEAAPLIPTVVTSFTDHVQPILLNRCSQSGCHGLSATNKLKIIQPIGTARARISEQNCRSALQFVEVDDSHMSTLLRYAMIKHGIQKEPSITTQETGLVEVLQSWTTFARNPVLAAVNTSSGAAAGGAMQAVYTGSSPGTQANNGFYVGAGSFGVGGLLPVDPRSGQLRAVPRQTQVGAQSPSNGPSLSELDQLDDEVRRALGEPPRNAAPAAETVPAGTAPADPFDPAEFNRRAAAKSLP